MAVVLIWISAIVLLLLGWGIGFSLGEQNGIFKGSRDERIKWMEWADSLEVHFRDSGDTVMAHDIKTQRPL